MRNRRIASDTPRRSVAYVRVSTEDQATKGVSIDAQEARIRGYATAMALEAPRRCNGRDCSASSPAFGRARSEPSSSSSSIV
jgi:DNA invertase Pin-like site-specific DNA recombinase